MPMRREILEMVDGNEDLALKVWFVLQSMHNMNLVVGVTSVSLENTGKVGLGALANGFSGTKLTRSVQLPGHGSQHRPHLLLAGRRQGSEEV